MTLRQTIQAAPAKASELIAKLADTSNSAVKTREKLLGELGNELRLYADLEQKHLFPVLRKHEATKELAGDAAKASRALLGMLGDLEQAPKDGDAFLEKLGELKMAFQQHLRDERKELLPVILKALDAEVANDLAVKIDAGVAEAENAKREEAREARDAAKRERDASEARAEAERAEARTRRADEKAARERAEQAANVVRLEAASAQEAGRQVVEAVADQADRATVSVSSALSAYRESAQVGVEDLRAVNAASTVSARGLAEVGSAWSDWFGKAARTNTEAVQRLVQCRTLQQVAEAQREFGTSVMRNWMEANARVLEAAQQTSRQALKPLTARLQSGT